MAMKLYSIQDISTAWFKFTQPKYLVDKNKIEDLEPNGIIQCEDVASVIELKIDYSRWITYLISEEWKK